MTQAKHPQHIIDRILLLHRERQSATVIGVDVGLSRNAIIGIIHRQRTKAGIAWEGPPVMSKNVPRGPKAPTIRKPSSPIIERLLAKKLPPKSTRGRITGLNIASNRFDTRPEPIDIPSIHDWKQPDYTPSDTALTKPADIIEVRECRAPVQKRAGVQLFCNVKRRDGSSYCPHHHRMFNFEPRSWSKAS